MRQNSKKHNSLAVMLWTGALLMLPIQAVSLSIFSPNRVLAQQVLAQKSVPQLSEAKIKQIAQSITVKVTSGEYGGTGILIRKEGNVYTVLTNRHVLESGKPIKIQTPDGKAYSANLVKGMDFQGKDLALLQFGANANYSVAALANLSTVAVNESIYAAGFPSGANSSQTSGFTFKNGQVLLLSEQAFREGYQIGYSNEIEKGMSGGPILNRRGQVVGINGIHAFPLWGDPYVYENGTKPTEALRDLMSRYSWGIPIQTFARLAPRYTSQSALASTNKPAVNKPNTLTNLPPIANEVNNIAQEITVQVNVPNSPKCSGSGVIVAKQGNTYTVLTAEHVIRESLNCDRTSLSVVTADGQRYPVKPISSDAKGLPGSDLAVLQFNSNQNYRVATLATYDLIKDDGFIFVSGWSSRPNSTNSQRLFTAGQVASKQLGSLVARNRLSFTYGYGLFYTNVTEQGMSGGPVLDTRGRVIGIHGRAEEEEITDKTGKNRFISLGFSLGVPTSNFLRWAKQDGLISALKVETTAPPALTKLERAGILSSLLKAEKPSDNADAIDWLNYGWQLARNATDKELAGKLGENKTEEAIRAVDKAIQLEPNFYQAWYLRGMVQAIAGEQYQEALKSFEKATQIQPKFDPAWRFRGIVLLNLERYPEAQQSFEQVIKLDPNDDSAQIFRSMMLLRLERYQETLEISNRVLERNPNSWAYFARGAARIAAKDFKNALVDLNEAIRLNPEYIEAAAYSLRGVARFATGDKKGAFNDLDEAVQLDSKDADIFKIRGKIRSEQEDYKGAIADFNEVLRLNPKEAEAYYLRGMARLTQGDKKGALADSNEAIRLNPKIGYAYSVRGLVRFAEGDKKGAFADLDESVRLNPKDADILTIRAGIRFQEKDYAGAASDFSEAIQINPKNTVLIQARGNTRLQLQDYKGAVADFNEVISLNPKDADAYYNRGTARAQLRDYQGAVEDFNQILSSQELSGIGVQTEINSVSKMPTVTRVIENSPADKQGLKTGDQIQSIDGKSTANMSLEQVIKLIRGQNGTQVTLRIARGNNTLNISLTRAQIIDTKFANVYYQRGIARSQLKDSQGARADFQQAASLFQQQGKRDEYQQALAKMKELQQ
jgi:tetratricopeptide (TPR) repeat protein/V8-like Glu-specific endopeptidase